jgi:hypothetical protein
MSTVSGKKSAPAAGRLGGRGGDEHDGVADLHRDGAVGLTGELAGRELQGLVGLTGRRIDGDGISHVDLLLDDPSRGLQSGDGHTSSQW